MSRAERLRRFLEDLRSGLDRRTVQDRRMHQRRSGAQRVEQDRREPGDRRKRERRLLGERRRSIFQTFSDDEALEIHEMLNDPESPVSCPRCEGNLLLARLQRQGVEHATAVVCTGCYGRLELTGPSAAI